MQKQPQSPDPTTLEVQIINCLHGECSPEEQAALERDIATHPNREALLAFRKDLTTTHDLLTIGGTGDEKTVQERAAKVPPLLLALAAAVLILVAIRSVWHPTSPTSQTSNSKISKIVSAQEATPKPAPKIDPLPAPPQPEPDLGTDPTPSPQSQPDQPMVNPPAMQDLIASLMADKLKAEVDMVTKKTRLDLFEDLDPKDLAAAVSFTIFDTSLQPIMERLHAAKENKAVLERNLGPRHPDILRVQEGIREIETQLDNTVKSIQRALLLDYKIALKRHQTLELQLKKVEHKFGLDKSK